jgi:predicted AlkP superfamily phosphohydrolase/phosphomutase
VIILNVLKNQVRPEIAILGIDGLDPFLTREWMKVLPNFCKLIQEGSFIIHRSSLPPLSIPAWQNFYTGKQPGKHGVFGFMKRNTGSYSLSPVSSQDIKTETLWSILDRYKVSGGYVNVPLTYPPSILQYGYMVSGWPAPENKKIFSPLQIKKLIDRCLGEPYRVQPYPIGAGTGMIKMDNNQLLSAILKTIEMRKKVMICLIKNIPTRLFMGVFTAVDVASHHFSCGHRDLLKQVYVAMDKAIGEILKFLPEQTNIIIVSDHGHSIKGNLIFNINEWLSNKGYLTKYHSGANRYRNILMRTGFTLQKVIGLVNALGLSHLFRRLRWLSPVRRFIPDDEAVLLDEVSIDWALTYAFSFLQNTIHLNVQKREPMGQLHYDSPKYRLLRERIIKGLKSLRSPVDGKILNVRVFVREEIYSGPYEKEAPDLVFIIGNMSCAALPRFSHKGKIFLNREWGEHRQEGVLILKGPAFKKGKNLYVNLIDIMPTILKVLDLPIPKDVDGKILRDVLLF